MHYIQANGIHPKKAKPIWHAESASASIDRTNKRVTEKIGKSLLLSWLSGLVGFICQLQFLE